MSKNPEKYQIYKYKCLFCWKWFKTKIKNSRYCNRSCFELHSKELRKWKNNPSYRNWTYSYKSMTEKEYKESKHITIWFWEKELQRNSRYIRDQQQKKKWYYYCEHCLTKNTMRWETHHLIYRSEIPKHKDLHNKRNLLRLCIKCHNEFHKNKKLRTPYIQERNLSELFWTWWER